MKKTVRLIALILLCALLGSCTAAAADVSALIANIGPITLDSGDAIAAAEQRYGALNSFAKKKVENYGDLQEARQRYDDIVSRNDRLHQLADALGEITLDSKDAIAHLKEEYYIASVRYGIELFADFSLRWEEIQAQYTLCELEAKLEEVERLCEEKNYLDAWILATEVHEHPAGWKLRGKSSALVARCSVLFNEQVIITAQQQLDSGDPVGALDTLLMLNADYSGDAAYRRVYNGSIQMLEDNRPKNGAVLDRTLSSGRNVFKISVPSGQDYCVRLELEENPTQYVMFYIQGGKTASVKVPSGTYKLKYVSGNYWCGAEIFYFYEGPRFFAADTNHTVKSTGTTYTQVKISLNATEEGNMPTQQIGRYDFDGYAYTKPSTDL